MKKIKVYIACSLDGYIARPDGSIDWLESLPNPNQLDYGYTDFIATIDTVVMGRNTYQEVLGFDVPWPYADCTTYVVSTNPDLELPTENTRLINSDLSGQLKKIAELEGKDIWIVGGGPLIAALLSEQLVDDLLIFIMPILIGSGIPLFPEGVKETTFALAEAKAYETGVVQLHYKKKE
jgi:dihydrofolate reductase